MSQMVEMPDELYSRLATTAEAGGLTPLEWLDANLPPDADREAGCARSQPMTLADRFAGRIGRFSSGNGEPRLEDLRDSFVAYLEAKHGGGGRDAV